jgi:hypothetical protein
LIVLSCFKLIQIYDQSKSFKRDFWGNERFLRNFFLIMNLDQPVPHVQKLYIMN